MVFEIQNFHHEVRAELSIRIIFLINSCLFGGLEVYSLFIGSHYRYDILMCFGLLLAFYRLKQRLQIPVIEFFLLAFFLMVHALGVFQLYESYPLGIEYDYWVHGLFGFTAAMICFRVFHFSTNYSITKISIATITMVLGIAAAHELYEFAGALLLGEGEGVLFIGAGDLDQWDTQKDILNNLIGGLAGVAVGYWILKRQHWKIIL